MIAMRCYAIDAYFTPRCHAHCRLMPGAAAIMPYAAAAAEACFAYARHYDAMPRFLSITSYADAPRDTLCDITLMFDALIFFFAPFFFFFCFFFFFFFVAIFYFFLFFFFFFFFFLRTMADAAIIACDTARLLRRHAADAIATAVDFTATLLRSLPPPLRVARRFDAISRCQLIAYFTRRAGADMPPFAPY